MSAVTIQDHIGKRLAAYRSVAIWGAGSGAAQALREWLPRDRIAWAIDSRAGQPGAPTEVAGVPVVSAAIGAERAPDCIVVCTDAYLEVFDTLRAMAYPGAVFYVLDLFPATDEMGEWQRLRIDLGLQKMGNWFDTLTARPQILVNVTYRLTRLSAALPGLSHLARLVHAFTCSFFGISLPPSVVAGPGLAFSHIGTVVIHPRAQLGRFVRIYHLATIGANDSGHCPIIGDFATIYTGALVLGSSRVGRHCRIGAQAFLSDMEVPDGATVVGSPARVLSTRTLPLA